MKKHLLLLLMAGLFTFTSCSDDDDGSNNEGNDIVGTWVLVDVIPSSDFFNVEDCPENSTITFNSDKSGSGTFYLAENNCEAEQTEGNWRYDDGLYYIEVPVIGSQPGTVLFEGDDKFYFSSQQLTGLTLTFERE